MYQIEVTQIIKLVENNYKLSFPSTIFEEEFLLSFIIKLLSFN